MFSCHHLVWNPKQIIDDKSKKKVKMTSNQHAPYALGDTRATMVETKGCDPTRAS